MTTTDVTSTTDTQPVNAEFVTFHVTMGPNESVHPNEALIEWEQQEILRVMAASVRLFHPKASVTLLTDPRTASLGWSRRCRCIIREINPKQLMLERALAQQSHIANSRMTAPMVLLDSDILLNQSLGDLFRRSFDVALTWRPHGEMPINGGFMVLNADRPDVSKAFFDRFVAIYRERYSARSDWFGDQLALRDCVGLRAEQMTEEAVVDCDGCRVLLLSCNRYNFSPVNRYRSICSRLDDKTVLHFKGQRKRLMIPFWRAWLQPAHSLSPWVQFNGWRERRKIALLADAERAGSVAAVNNEVKAAS